MSQQQEQDTSANQPLSQQQLVGDIQVPGSDNTLNFIQGQVVTFTQTKIYQIPRNEIKDRELITASPYKGLSPFEPDDGHRFFGRDQFLASLINKLEHSNLLLLLGASGSGKSSIIRAGLIPWLKEKWGTRFKSLIFTPDSDPFVSLFGSLLACQYKQSQADIAKAGEADTLSQVVTQLKPKESFWLIFIDQFEELFTVSDPEKRDRFITSLVELSQARADDPLVRIVATMRADFLDQFDPFPANRLATITETSRPLITQMQPDELRLAIEQPAAFNGVVFEEGLVDEITAEVQGRAGCLPLLQFTLERLWDAEFHRNHLQDRTLRTATYRCLGGVRGALQQHVDRMYGQLSPAKKLATKRIFLRLVQVGDEASETECKPFRRRADLSEFTNPLEQTVLRQLIKERLLVSGEQSTPIDSSSVISQHFTVEIAHEVLLTSWNQLNDWIWENREAIKLRNRLNADVKQWIATQSDDELWSGSKLKDAVNLRDAPDFNEVLGGFHEDAKRFIDASEGLANRKKEEQKQQELKVRITAGDERKEALMKLLEDCTVKLSIPGQAGISTGFFVAPGRILTSATEIVSAKGETIKVSWQNQKCKGRASIDRCVEGQNLAILKLETPHVEHPCVYLDTTARADHSLCTFGYSDSYSAGGYAVGTILKSTEKNPSTIEFKTYTNSLQLQSSPLLNWHTSKVCGIVRSTHAHVRSESGQYEDITIGKAIPVSALLSVAEDLKQEQRQFHKKERGWSELLPRRCKPTTVALASLGMTALVVAIRAFQVFQPLELGFYDTLMRHRLNAPQPSDRILIVHVTKQDAEAQEQRGEKLVYSLSNETLITLLKKITALNPIAVGLDVYREQGLDRLQPSQRQTLTALFQQPNLFGVCKVEDEKQPDGVEPPPIISAERVGFSDFSRDNDRVIRRQLLAFTPPNDSKCLAEQSFSLQVATHYLQNMPEKIQTSVEVAENVCQISFSNGVTLPKLEANTGGYQGYSGNRRSLFNGCQVLLNYREQQQDTQYDTVTLEEFLAEEFPIQNFRDRIVLIGINRTDGFGDNWTTPYNMATGEIKTGVMIQAHMIDHIIDTALQKNSLIWTLPRGIDLSLILIAALTGGVLGWAIQSSRKLLIVVMLIGSSGLVTSVLLFQLGAWVPLMPPLLTLSATSSFVFWLNLRLKSISPAKPPKPVESNEAAFK